MMIRVDPSSNVPVFQQVVNEVKSAIARGAIMPGEVIPSVRQMAADTLLNPNTVAKAYRELEREGIVYTRRGLGIFVAERAGPLTRTDRREELNDRIRKLIAEARRAGMTTQEIRSLVEAALRSAAGSAGPQNRAMQESGSRR